MTSLDEPRVGEIVIKFETEITTITSCSKMCIVKHNGSIFRASSDGVRGQIGTVKASVLNFSTGLNLEISLQEIFRADSHTEKMFDAFTDNSGTRFKNKLNKEYDLEQCSSLLIIECIDIDPQHRGLCIGLIVCDITCFTIGAGCGLVALKVCPLKFKGGDITNEKVLQEYYRYIDFTRNTKKAVNKLKNHFMKIYFEELSDSILIRKPLRKLDLVCP